MPEEPGPKRLRLESSSVILNIGGEHFRTSVQTMRSFPSSYFGALFSGRHKGDFDKDGSLFIDRSPKNFGLILEYLRNGKETPLDVQTATQLDEIRLEAEYCGLTHLALKCRRFKLLDGHFISQARSNSGHFTVVHGMRTAAAMFDVVDPDNFEVTFAGRSEHPNSGDDFTDLHECVNAPGVLVGLVPKDADLSAEWEPYDNPLPQVSPGPFDATDQWSCAWAQVDHRFPLNPREVSHHWPQTLYLPPALQHGIACSLTVGLFADSKSNSATGYSADGFLSRFVLRGSIAIQSSLAKWWNRLPGSVAMRFTRAHGKCNLRVVLHDDDPNYHDYELDLASLGLDTQLPYRPVIFWGVGTRVDVANMFDNSLAD